jgi:hypothetical protein
VRRFQISIRKLVLSQDAPEGATARAPSITLALTLLLTFTSLLLSACGGGSSSPSQTPTQSPISTTGLTRLSSDAFTNSSSQHATEVEPGAFSSGSTIVTGFQVARIFSGGGADIGFATSTNSGGSWSSGTLPGITVFDGGTFSAVSDAAVAFDLAHNVWLISSLAIGTDTQVLTSRSADGVHWDNPVVVAPTLNADKNWITCDTSAISPYFGHCYAEWDDPSSPEGLIWMSTSRDGGLTWETPLNTSDMAGGIGGQPVVQPNGTVIVPILGTTDMLSFRSTDGGATWTATISIATVTDHLVNGNLRTSSLPAGAIDGAGKVYVAWEDCRFRIGCGSNDIVISTSSDGISWSVPARVPIDDASSTADHFIPGLGIDALTSGSTAHLGLTYYFYPQAACTETTCALNAGFISSDDGGTSWSNAQTLVGPMNVTWLPNTFAGLMVADYVSTAYAGGKAFAIFAVAQPNSGTTFDEAIYTNTSGFVHELSTARLSATQDLPLAGAHSDHPPRTLRDINPELAPEE